MRYKSQSLPGAAVQALAVNIFALVRHAAAPSNLLGLRELHVDMVGSMEGSCLDPGGLPCLPQLTKLVMTINTKVSHGWLHRTPVHAYRALQHG